MTRDILYAAKIRTDFKTADLMEELLLAQGLNPSLFYCIVSGMAEISLYVNGADEADELRDRVEKQLRCFPNSFEPGKFRVSVEQIEKEDWAESWKRFFHRRKVSDSIVIKPSWEEYTGCEGEIVVEIDPGMSFGTGIHASTQGCIRFLDKLSDSHVPGSMIDMGCGSGILSIVASKLGFSPVVAFDSDPDSIRIAEMNIERTGCCLDCKTFQMSLDEFHGIADFDVVAANILAPTLIRNAKNIVSALRRSRDSRIIISGILKEQYGDVLESFMDMGMEELEAITIGEWVTSLLGIRPHEL